MGIGWATKKRKMRKLKKRKAKRGAILKRKR